MAIYEYACTSCGHKMEAMQKMSDPSLQECPSCKQNTLKRLMSVPGLHFKGTGWHVNDSRGSSQVGTSSETPSCCSGGGCACAAN